MGYVTPIIVLHQERIHLISRIALSHIAATLKTQAAMFWTAYRENHIARSSGGLCKWDSLWLTASKNLWNSQSNKGKEMNSPNNLEFGSRFFTWASTWKHNLIKCSMWDPKVATPTKLCLNSWPTETRDNVCCFKLRSLWGSLHRNRKLIQILAPSSGTRI